MSQQNSQTSLPPEVPGKTPDICAWCGEPSIGQITIQPDKYKWTKPDEDGKRIRYLTKRAIIAKVCGYHYTNLKLNA